MGALYLGLQEVANEILQQTKAPDALVGMELLASVSAAAQGLYDVQLPTGQIKPVSLYLVAVAESGERKTGIHNLVARPLYEFDEMRMKEHLKSVKRYEREIHVWNAIDAGLQRELVKLTQRDQPSDDLQVKLGSHRDAMPVKPRSRRLMRQNATERAIMDALEGDGESLTFTSDEGEVILKGGALGRTGIINKTWDGASMLVLDRSDGVSVIARNPRMTMSYMVQPKVFKAFLEQRGDAMRSSGHWARYLIGFPTSTQGMRYVFQLGAEWRHLPKFYERLRELLSEFGKGLDSGARERTVLEFSEDAIPRWVEATNNIEAMLNPCNYMHDIKDFASKMLEISARVAALLHVYSRQEGKISCESLNRAIEIVSWHLEEFKRMFSPEAALPQHLIDAQAIEHYLQHQYWNHGVSFVKKNDVLRSGPVRTRARVDAALDFLQMNQRLFVQVGIKKTRYISRTALSSGW
jgi:hypothetical protein